MAVVALRDVFGIAHPTFLSAEAWNEEGHLSFDMGAVVHDDPVPAEPALPSIIHPADRDELVELVDRTLTVGFGKPFVGQG